jgi:hypothetical protein
VTVIFIDTTWSVVCLELVVVGNELCVLICCSFAAISQRDYKVYYVHLAQRKYQIMEEITKFFKENIRGNFPVPNCE